MTKFKVNQTAEYMKRYIAIFVLFLYAFTFFAPKAHAAPSGDISKELSGAAENMSFVEINADVPSDFKGSVSVLVSHESGEYYTITCDKLSGYRGIREIPVGEYYVEQVFTSEDSFLYDAYLETDSFVLEDLTQLLEVTVTANSLGQEFLENPDAFGQEESLPEDEVVEEAPGTQESPSASEEVPDPEQENKEPESLPTDDAKEEAPEDSSESEAGAFSMLKHILIFLCGSAVFCGIVFVIVYFVRKRNS